MAIDLHTIDERLAKAKEDVAFWENARNLFLDPRISGVDSSSPVRFPLPSPTPLLQAASRPYGDLKRQILNVLPDYNPEGITTTQIVNKLSHGGYIFASRTPGVAVNDALVSLGGQVAVVAKRGVAKLWTKARPLNVWDGENAPQKEIEDQQQTPP